MCSGTSRSHLNLVSVQRSIPSIHWHHQLHTLLVHLLPDTESLKAWSSVPVFQSHTCPCWSDPPLPSPSSRDTAVYLHQSHHSHHLRPHPFLLGLPDFLSVLQKLQFFRTFSPTTAPSSILLPVQQHINGNILSNTCKALNHLAPFYLTDALRRPRQARWKRR